LREPFAAGTDLAAVREGFLGGIGLLIGACNHWVALLYANWVVLLRANNLSSIHLKE
jgi:hypothetical protein